MSKRGDRRSSLVGWLVLAIGLAVAVVGWRPALSATGLYVDGASSTVPPGFFDPVPTEPSAARPVAPVLEPVPRADVPDAGAVTRRMAVVPRANLGSVGMVFLDAASGAVVHREREQALLVPASNMKVLSTTVALRVLGAGKTFETTVVRSAPDQIVLVGGGDPFLSVGAGGYPQGASLQALARQTATALKADGRTAVRMGWDTTLFTGPNWHPDWTESYLTEVSPITSLWVGKGKNPDGVRQRDPAGVAARAFIGELAKQGIRVTGAAPMKAPAGATRIAVGRSASVGAIVEQIMLASDNDAAEVLGRHAAAAAGKPASFAGVSALLTEQLRELGVWQDGAVIADASGLSKRSRVSAVMLAQALRLAHRDPRLGSVISGLPLAGVTGTLQNRYATDAGRGRVWAKTGFLAGIHGLSGLLVTRDGAVVVFSMIVNGQVGRGVAQPALDKLVSAVVTCGCKG